MAVEVAANCKSNCFIFLTASQKVDTLQTCFVFSLQSLVFVQRQMSDSTEKRGVKRVSTETSERTVKKQRVESFASGLLAAQGGAERKTDRKVNCLCLLLVLMLGFVGAGPERAGKPTFASFGYYARGATQAGDLLAELCFSER